MWRERVTLRPEGGPHAVWLDLRCCAGAGAPPPASPAGRFPERVLSALGGGWYDAAIAAAHGWVRTSAKHWPTSSDRGRPWADFARAYARAGLRPGGGFSSDRCLVVWLPTGWWLQRHFSEAHVAIEQRIVGVPAGVRLCLGGALVRARSGVRGALEDRVPPPRARAPLRRLPAPCAP